MGIVESVGIELLSCHAELERRGRAFVDTFVRPNEDEHSDDFAISVVDELGEAGLLDACVDLDVRGICVLREVVAHSSGVVDSMVARQALGYAPLELAGTPDQKKRWREAVRKGQAIPALALAEPEAGSDVAKIQMTATREGEDWVLKGEKCFVTNAGLADFYLTFARTSDDGSRGISAFIVSPDEVDVERYDLMAPRPCGALFFDGVRVGPEALVGEVGHGFELAMATLDRLRPTVGAAAVGMAGRALDEAQAPARTRKPFNGAEPIGAMIANSWAELSAARLLVYRAATAFARETEDAGRYASAATMLAMDVAQRIIERAMQIHGGRGLLRGSPVERLYREIRALRIDEGTTEIQRDSPSSALLGSL